MELLVVCTDKSTGFKKEKSGLHGMLSVLRFAQKFSIRIFQAFLPELFLKPSAIFLNMMTRLSTGFGASRL